MTCVHNYSNSAVFYKLSYIVLSKREEGYVVS